MTYSHEKVLQKVIVSEIDIDFIRNFVIAI
jgi:hypothetical protein